MTIIKISAGCGDVVECSMKKKHGKEQVVSREWCSLYAHKCIWFFDDDLTGLHVLSSDDERKYKISH